MTSLPLLMLDCDGVLVNSERANIAYYNGIFSHFGLRRIQDSDEEDRRLLHTLSTPQVIAHYFTPESRGEALRFADGLDFMEFSEFLSPVEGWLETLAAVKGEMDICVATNRGRSATRVLDAVGLLESVDRVFTILDVNNPKPAPDLLLFALASYGADKASALYVGDSQLDREAARTAGVTFVGFRTGGDFTIENPSELGTVVQFRKAQPTGERE